MPILPPFGSDGLLSPGPNSSLFKRPRKMAIFTISCQEPKNCKSEKWAKQERMPQR